MRRIVAAGLLGCALCAHSPARAQVTEDPGALDALQPTPPGTAAPPPERAAPRPPLPNRGHHVSPPANTGKSAPLAATPPPAAQLPPPVIVPLRPSKPPPPVAVSSAAPGAMAPIPGGVRITFGSDTADLNDTTYAALHEFARQVKDDPSIRVTISAYAAGRPDDPSTPRRLSLLRALNARTVLMQDGIASTRIIVRAMGTPPPSLAAIDRVDVVAYLNEAK